MNLKNSIATIFSVFKDVPKNHKLPGKINQKQYLIAGSILASLNMPWESDVMITPLPELRMVRYQQDLILFLSPEGRIQQKELFLSAMP